jgi:hypothetical protein
MELQLFVAADFVVSRPTVYQFLLRYGAALGCTKLAMHMIRYVGELSLLAADSIGVKPSLLAGAVICVARTLLREQPLWPSTLQQYTNITISELRPLATRLFAMIKDVTSGGEWFVTRVFAEADFSRVSTFPVPDELPLA